MHHLLSPVVLQQSGEEDLIGGLLSSFAHRSDHAVEVVGHDQPYRGCPGESLELAGGGVGVGLLIVAWVLFIEKRPGTTVGGAGARVVYAFFVETCTSIIVP